MPIRASEAARYPHDWKAISARIKARAGGRCECQGECGLHPPKPLPRRCVEQHGTPAQFARGTVILTVAHLGDPSPENCAEDNLKAMCQRCHLRYDLALHQQHAAQTRRRKKQNLELFAARDRSLSRAEILAGLRRICEEFAESGRDAPPRAAGEEG